MSASGTKRTDIKSMSALSEEQTLPVKRKGATRLNIFSSLAGHACLSELSSLTLMTSAALMSPPLF